MKGFYCCYYFVLQADLVEGSAVREPHRGGVSQVIPFLRLNRKYVSVWYSGPNSSLPPIQRRHASALPECEFGFENSLPLQSSTLSDEQVVVVSLERSFVNIKHFVPQVKGHAVVRIGKLKACQMHCTSCSQCPNPRVKLLVPHTCRQTISQYVHCSLLFHFPPRLS